MGHEFLNYRKERLKEFLRHMRLQQYEKQFVDSLNPDLNDATRWQAFVANESKCRETLGKFIDSENDIQAFIEYVSPDHKDLLAAELKKDEALTVGLEFAVKDRSCPETQKDQDKLC